MTLEICFDAALFRREVDKLVKKQIPFAFSLALNETINDTRDQLVDDLPGSFTIRSAWTKKGIRTKRATKRHLVATVGTKDDYMALQATGGVAKGAQAVPVGARPRPKSKTMRGKWPRALVRKGAFIMDRGFGPAVYMATKHKNKKRRKLRIMYKLVKRVEIPQRWDLEQTLWKVTGREWTGNVKWALERALKSRRRR